MIFSDQSDLASGRVILASLLGAAVFVGVAAWQPPPAFAEQNTGALHAASAEMPAPWGEALLERPASAATGVVGCRLPPRIAKLGRVGTFLAPGRIVQLTAESCVSRGGSPIPK